MPLDEAIDEHFLMKYRALLDAEDIAFDELEHAYEEGDREHWAADLDAWKEAIDRKLGFLRKHGIELPDAVSL
jgi:hypothetical protein